MQGPDPAASPVEVSINESNYPAEIIIVRARLESNEWLRLMVDTGAPTTILDKSFEAKLQHRLGTTNLELPFDINQESQGVFVSPKLYLDGAQLITGRHIVTMDLQKFRSYPVDGILGMDCLQHYCIQLDFAARKLRLFDSNHLLANDLGKAFPITYGSGPQPVISANLLGTRVIKFVADTGSGLDLLIPGKTFEETLQQHKPSGMRLGTTAGGQVLRIAAYSDATISDEQYVDIQVSENSVQSEMVFGFMGLRFLGRHLVTFNFPKQMMYLKQVSSEPYTNAVVLQKPD